MTEGEAKAWFVDRVSRETFKKLERFADAVIEAATQQNLIAASTLPHVWSRHLLDSAQLVDLAPAGGTWIDLGSGAGFPGVVVGILAQHRVALVEARAKRVAFLRGVVAALELSDTVEVIASRVESVRVEPASILSARAFAPLERLFSAGHHLSSLRTRWILPKGRSAHAELDVARRSWQGAFTVAPSITDPDASIIVAEKVRPLGGARKG